MRYQLVFQTTRDGLVADINTYISLGWKPQGGVSVCYAGGFVFCQAVIKEQE